MAIFRCMSESENKYLQKVNLEALQKETGLDMKGLADLAGIGPKVVYKWAYLHKDSSRPDYNAIVRLLSAHAAGGLRVLRLPRGIDAVQEVVHRNVVYVNWLWHVFFPFL